MIYTMQMVALFNKKTQLLVEYIGREKVPDVVLSLKHVTNLGVDGVLISTGIMINQRIRYYSPRAIAHHCAPHKTDLAISHGTIGTARIRRNEFLYEGLTHHKMLCDLVKSSAKQRDYFMAAQEATEEYKEYGRTMALQFPKMSDAILSF